MCSCKALGQHWRTLRFYGNNLHIRILFFQICTNTANCTACSNTCYKNIDFSVGIVPNFYAGCFLVGFRICRIGELRRNKAVRNLHCQFVCFFNRTFHALCTLRQHQFCTVCFHQVSTFYTHRFRHGDNQTITSCSRN